jgi:hypothetical protein
MDNVMEECLLQNLLGKYENYARDFQTMEKTLFCEKYKDIIETYYRVENFIENCAIDDMTLFLLFSLKHNLIARVDWKGEDEPGEIKDNIAKMLKQQGVTGFAWKNKDPACGIPEEDLPCGEFLPALFRKLDRELEATGYRIAFVDTKADDYCYFVAPRDKYAAIECDEYIFDTSAYELYLTPDNRKNMKLALFVKNRLDIKSSEAMALMQQENILLETGQRNTICATAKKIAELGGKSIMKEKIS